MKNTLVSALLGGIAVAVLMLVLGTDPAQENAPSLPMNRPNPGTAPLSYARSVELATPAVVSIFTSKVATERDSRDPGPPGYFGNPPPERARQHLETNLGSGVIVGADGYVLTNLHILEGAGAIKVVLADGRNVRVRFVGKDPDTDLAILKMEHSDVPAIPIGSSADLEVGDVVLAIGNPFGVGQTVTMGIVSATGRAHLGISRFENFIQTDAAINPGNSGGALIDAQGALIGINTAIFSQSGGSHGIGFAIPVDIAMSVLRQILNRGHVSRGWIGITGRDVTPQTQAAYGLQGNTGVMISGVLEDSPAERAGLRAGDVITEIDDKVLNDAQALLQIVSDAGPDHELHITAWRGSERLDLLAVTTTRPAVSR